ncbi:MAG: tetratricopeptide repeat protein [Thiobacillaceae bacterium]
MNDIVNITVKVQDETGHPIPFVTVWQFVQINPAHVKDTSLDLTMEDLWRCTLRYRETAEYAINYGLKPVPLLQIPVMGNGEGEVHDVIDYQRITGKGNHFPRPDPLVFGYTFMKRGYFPNKLAFTLPKGVGQAEGVVTLKRDPSDPIDDSPYMQAYDRIRYELSDTHKNTAMSRENHFRQEGLRQELELAAQQALAANDNKAAARIYIRMRYLPELTFLDGRIAGFKQTNIESERSKLAFKRAGELDPTNLFIQMETIGTRFPASATQEERIRKNAAQLDALIAKYGDAVWPEMLRWRASSYANLGDYTKARTLYLEAAKLEPKFTDWNKLVDDLKLSMGRKGVPVPADW